MARRTQFPPAAAVLLLSPLLSVAAQTSPTPTSPTRIHLTGTVHNGVTGKPVRRALVSSLDSRFAALTDSDGRFSFDVPAPSQPAPGGAGGVISGNSGGLSVVGGLGGDSFALRAQKPGFLPEEPIILPLGTAGPAPEIDLRLMPAAVVTGTVSAPSTDSAHGVPVTLLRHEVQDGDRMWMQIVSSTTDRNGAFRFPDLRPGEYSVVSGEWRGDRPLSVDPAAITEQYPPVFLGDTSTLTPTGILHLHPGDTAQAPLHLHPAVYFPVTIPVRSPGAASWVNVQVFAADGLSEYRLGYNAQDHAVEGALPSGRYTVLLSGPPDPQGFATVALEIGNAPVHTAPVSLIPSGTLLVRVRREFTTEQQKTPGSFNVNVNLRPEEPGRGSFGASNQPGDRDEFPIANLQPGRYRVNIQPYPGYVSSATSGSTDLLHDPLVIGANGSAAPIRITVRDDGATVTGTVTAESSTPRLTVTAVLLLPTSGSGQYTEGFAFADGNFSIGNVVPGSYRLLALRSHPGQLPFRDPDAMRDLLGTELATAGVTLTVAPGETVRKDVPLLDHPLDTP